MLRIILRLIKVSLFAALILALGTVVEWQGTTLSDHAKVAVKKARTVAAEILGDAKMGNTNARVALDQSRERLERFASGERQKIEGFIGELKRSQEDKRGRLGQEPSTHP